MGVNLTFREDSSRSALGQLVCSKEAREVDGPMVVINIMKTKDKVAAEKYTTACFSFFPSIGTDLFLLGKLR